MASFLYIYNVGSFLSSCTLPLKMLWKSAIFYRHQIRTGNCTGTLRLPYMDTSDLLLTP